MHTYFYCDGEYDTQKKIHGREPPLCCEFHNKKSWKNLVLFFLLFQCCMYDDINKTGTNCSSSSSGIMFCVILSVLNIPDHFHLRRMTHFRIWKKRRKKEAEVKAGSVDSQSGISTYKIMLSSRGSEGEATSKWTQAGFTDSPACLKRMHNTMPKAWEKDCRKMFRVSSDTNQHEEAKYS